MNNLGRLLFIIGLVLVVVGAVLWSIGGRGRLLGDITVQNGHSTFPFPIVTCLLLGAI